MPSGQLFSLQGGSDGLLIPFLDPREDFFVEKCLVFWDFLFSQKQLLQTLVPKQDLRKKVHQLHVAHNLPKPACSCPWALVASLVWPLHFANRKSAHIAIFGRIMLTSSTTTCCCDSNQRPLGHISAVGRTFRINKRKQTSDVQKKTPLAQKDHRGEWMCFFVVE